MANSAAFARVEPGVARPLAPSRRDFLTGSPAEEPGGFWLRAHRRAMACRFEITIASEPASWLRAVRAALDAIDRLADELSVFRDTSAIRRINRDAIAGAVAIGDDLLARLLHCDDLRRTKATLILVREQDAMLFEDGSAADRSTAIEVAPRTSGPAAQSSETMAGNTRQGAAVATPGAAAPVTSEVSVRVRGSRIMIQRFCSAVRVGMPLSCGVEKALDSARACIRANEAINQKARLTI